MMVNGRHLEDAASLAVLLLSIFEIGDLNHHGERLQNVDQRHQNQHQMLMRCQSH